MKILAIETATDVLSLALGAGARTHETTLAAGARQAELVLGEIDALLRRARLTVRDLDAIAFGAGPGAFTGLRIACGVAQGIATARALPVLGVGTLAALAEASGARRVIACLDARMGEVYHAAFEKRDGALHEIIPPGLARPAALPVPPGGGGWIGCGPGFAAHRDTLVERLGARLEAVRPEVLPTAAAVLRLAAPRFAAGAGEDPAHAAPIYVRDRVALKTIER
jgi:tRNA threonylcarbamoyladenosine biosynthesis protein TsaB